MTEVDQIPIPRGFLEIKKRWCKGCNLCADACPKGLISVDELGKVRVDRPEECVGCGLCEAICPDFAIRVNKNA
ncbi:MAG: 4Fe-4S dicluster domain-containing protein [Bacillota bacterium]